MFFDPFTPFFKDSVEEHKAEIFFIQSTFIYTTTAISVFYFKLVCPEL